MPLQNIFSLKADDRKIIERITRKARIAPIEIAEFVKGGANSRCFKLKTGDVWYFLKIYPQCFDGRTRLEREYKFLKFLSENGLERVAKTYLADYEIPAGLYSFIEGRNANRRITENDIEGAVSFVKDTKRLSGVPGSGNIGPASEACFSIREIICNLSERRKKLDSSSSEPLKKFLQSDFDPTFEEIKVKIQGVKAAEILVKEKRFLSPSDFGFHNAIRGEDGRLYFTDMEHAGWDDPVKMISDFLLHPQMRLTDEQKGLFSGKIISLFDKELGIRLKTVYPLYALKWSLIMLNEFTGRGWQRRQFSGKTKDIPESILSRQLKKAAGMVSIAREAYEK
ncbi:hypothetical protein A3E72_04940 [Candidatus Gottesmanbacteria bacterium RIFCSPHIGHO2_12_FULL_43_26]|nr:MAG: hypothetical protein A3E72_04940 [Candidatus Gottesmanbacteria bacterium RIFCSPHIGHO2_12_FULL_43_26]